MKGSALEVFYDNALYKFTFDIDIDIEVLYLENHGLDAGQTLNTKTSPVTSRPRQRPEEDHKYQDQDKTPRYQDPDQHIRKLVLNRLRH